MKRFAFLGLLVLTGFYSAAALAAAPAEWYCVYNNGPKPSVYVVNGSSLSNNQWVTYPITHIGGSDSLWSSYSRLFKQYYFKPVDVKADDIVYAINPLFGTPEPTVVHNQASKHCLYIPPV